MAMRGWGHYFVQAVPWVALLVGLVAEPFTAGAGQRFSWTAGCYQAVVLLPLFALTELLSYPEARGRRRWRRRGHPADLRAGPAARAPGQHIYMWGFWPEVHVWCQRRPASRYVFSTLPAGLMPWYEQTKEQDDAWLSRARASS